MWSATVGKDSRAATQLACDVGPGSAFDLPHGEYRTGRAGAAR
jgi:hypothetical protein